MATNTSLSQNQILPPTFDPQQTERELWLQQRRKGVGSSDAASLYNEGYGCHRRLVYDKRDVPVDFERTPEELSRMEAGTKLEDVVAREFIEDCNEKLRAANLPELKIRRQAAQEAKDNPDLRANIDRRFVAVAAESLYHLFPALRESLGDDPGSTGIMEVKTTEKWKLKSVKDDGAPLDWILQVQEQFAVVPDKWAIIVAKARDTWETLPVPILPDAELIADISKRATATMAIVRDENAPLPEPLPDPKDKRCGNCQWRRSCRGESNQALNAALVKEIGTAEIVVDESPEFVDLLNDYKRVDFQYEDLGVLRDAIKDKLKGYLGERTVVRSTQAQAVVKFTTVKGRESVDTKALKNELPDVYSKYLKVGAPSKRFEVICE